jgi:hypothetical protein
MKHLPNFRRLLIGLFGVKNVISALVHFSSVMELLLKIEEM